MESKRRSLPIIPMKGISRCVFLVLIFIFCASPSVLADAAETIEKYRASFEKRMNAELDEHGKSARELRQKYIQELNQLKVELGRAENLKGAAQVVAEIEAIEEGEEAKELPDGADPKFERVREEWERREAGIRTARTKKLSTTVKLYLKALDTEKRRLTRAGRIKDALLLEEEEKRVMALPEYKATVAAVKTETEKIDWKEFLPGRRYTYERQEYPGTRLILEFGKNGKAHFSPNKDRSFRWRVNSKDVVILSSSDWSASLHLVFAPDGVSYDGMSIPRKSWRRGKYIESVKIP